MYRKPDIAKYFENVKGCHERQKEAYSCVYSKPRVAHVMVTTDEDEKVILVPYRPMTLFPRSSGNIQDTSLKGSKQYGLHDTNGVDR